MKDFISPDQLEEKYGGDLPNLKEFWPPHSMFKNIIPFTKNRSGSYIDEHEHEHEHVHEHEHEHENDVFYSIQQISIDDEVNMNVMSELTSLGKGKTNLLMPSNRDILIEEKPKNTVMCGMCEGREKNECRLI